MAVIGQVKRVESLVVAAGMGQSNSALLDSQAYYLGLVIGDTMKKFSNNKDINNLVKCLIKNGWLVLNRKKHAILVAPSGRKMPIPSTPSDYRSWYNFSRDIKHINTKQGLFNGQ